MNDKTNYMEECQKLFDKKEEKITYYQKRVLANLQKLIDDGASDQEIKNFFDNLYTQITKIEKNIDREIEKKIYKLTESYLQTVVSEMVSSQFRNNNSDMLKDVMEKSIEYLERTQQKKIEPPKDEMDMLVDVNDTNYESDFSLDSLEDFSMGETVDLNSEAGNFQNIMQDIEALSRV